MTLSLAVENNNQEIMGMLVRAAINQGTNPRCSFARHHAIDKELIEPLKWLLQNGNITQYDLEQSGMFCTLNIPILELLFNHRASPHAIHEDEDYNIMQKASAHGKLNVIKWLVEEKGIQLLDDWDLFHYALNQHDDSETVSNFLRDQGLVSEWGQELKPINYAAIYCDPRVTDYFIEKSKESISMLNFFQDQGLDLDKFDENGYKPIHYAAMYYDPREIT